ncbi:glycoside hydrolase family 13 protein [Alicyclobacillus acidiphilus]|uniref:glycoside hydrolase family 13 protein n=1 Tax=Alicyclobacillus acidiphilus TaxID=182455 RepID=UPI000831FCAC|nr:alpha-glucosidase [Alicyclobacillus acidiphilus]
MNRTWWKETVVYQVYWRSFFDSDGDGYGDLEGVIQKLDYIQDLGAGVIWLNPCYESPDVDNGYDISDYYSVMEKAGDMNTLERLIRETHRRGMKLMMDVVLNHTSDQHPWFIDARSSKQSKYRDYYIWRDKPNNWRSYFTPSAWEFDEATEQYYFHSFAVQQPDLNWDNPELRQEMYRMLRFWLDKGVDGFRLDAIALLAKQENFPDSDEPENLSYLTNNPKLHDYLREMNEEVFSKYDIFTVGEAGFTTPEQGLLYVDERRRELNTIFHFQVLDEMPTWDLRRFQTIQTNWYETLKGRGWNSQFLNNHDHTRLVTRYGDDTRYRAESAKAFATMIHTLPGVPYIYQGEEIGMTGVRFDSIDDYHDVAMKNKYYEEVGKGHDPKDVFESLVKLSRDNSRTPMQWSSALNAGFSTGTPWIKVNPNYTSVNVEEDLKRPDSIYRYYQALIRLRKQYGVIVYGDFATIPYSDADVYVYTRRLGTERILVIVNFSLYEKRLAPIAEIALDKAQLLIGNYPEVAQPDTFRPFEARVYHLA